MRGDKENKAHSTYDCQLAAYKPDFSPFCKDSLQNH
jgi:hypothetical protein